MNWEIKGIKELCATDPALLKKIFVLKLFFFSYHTPCIFTKMWRFNDALQKHCTDLHFLPKWNGSYSAPFFFEWVTCDLIFVTQKKKEKKSRIAAAMYLSGTACFHPAWEVSRGWWNSHSFTVELRVYCISSSVLYVAVHWTDINLLFNTLVASQN